ncbi:hypothetical protein D3C83_76930 [compost metagenome]
MPSRRYADLGQNRLPAAGWTGNLAAAHGFNCPLHRERLDELVKEDRYSMFQRRATRFGHMPLSDFCRASLDQFSPVGGKKFVKHAEY